MHSQLSKTNNEISYKLYCSLVNNVGKIIFSKLLD